MATDKPSTAPHICGQIFTSQGGREWVCVRLPHPLHPDDHVMRRPALAQLPSARPDELAARRARKGRHRAGNV